MMAGSARASVAPPARIVNSTNRTANVLGWGTRIRSTRPPGLVIRSHELKRNTLPRTMPTAHSACRDRSTVSTAWRDTPWSASQRSKRTRDSTYAAKPTANRHRYWPTMAAASQPSLWAWVGAAGRWSTSVSTYGAFGRNATKIAPPVISTHRRRGRWPNSTRASTSGTRARNAFQPIHPTLFTSADITSRYPRQSFEEANEHERPARIPGSAGPLRHVHVLPEDRGLRPAAAGDLARAVAELRDRGAAGAVPGDSAPGVRPWGHALRPRQQLRAALRVRRGQLRRADGAGLPALPGRADHLHQGRVRHVEMISSSR